MNASTPQTHTEMAGLAAATVFLTASASAAGIIWLMTTQPESLFALLTTADDAWAVALGLIARLLAII